METFAADQRPAVVTKEVFIIVERPAPYKPLWIRAGVAWPNRDGSMKVVLHVLPKDGELLIRDPRPFEDRRSASPAPAL